MKLISTIRNILLATVICSCSGMLINIDKSLRGKQVHTGTPKVLKKYNLPRNTIIHYYPHARPGFNDPYYRAELKNSSYVLGDYFSQGTNFYYLKNGRLVRIDINKAHNIQGNLFRRGVVCRRGGKYYDPSPYKRCP